MYIKTCYSEFKYVYWHRIVYFFFNVASISGHFQLDKWILHLNSKIRQVMLALKVK